MGFCWSGSRIPTEASGRELLSSLARGGVCEVWTAAALLFPWNENLGDHLQRTKQCMEGRSETKRNWDPGDIFRP